MNAIPALVRRIHHQRKTPCSLVVPCAGPGHHHRQDFVSPWTFLPRRPSLKKTKSRNMNKRNPWILVMYSSLSLRRRTLDARTSANSELKPHRSQCLQRGLLSKAHTGHRQDDVPDESARLLRKITCGNEEHMRRRQYFSCCILCCPCTKKRHS